MKYRFIIDKDLASVYAKKGCKKCTGKGMLRFDNIGAHKSQWDYCSCARKNMKKYNK